MTPHQGISLSETPLSLPGTLEGFFELTHHPSRVLKLASCVTSGVEH